MKKNIREALPGFVGVKEFFRHLGNVFEPIVLDEARQNFYIAKMQELRGFPKDLFFNMKWAWCVDPHFREARKYPNGVTMVRIGVGLIVCGTGLARDTQNLLMAFDAEDRLIQYTVIAGNGKLEKGVNVYTCHDAIGVTEKHDSFDVAKRFVRTMVEDDFLIIEDAEYRRQYMQVLAGMEDGRLVFAVEYCLENFVLQFGLPYHVDADGVLALIAVLENEGFAALQDAAEWRQIDVEGYWESNGIYLDIDIGILAHIYRTEVVESDEAAQEMRDIYNTRSEDEDPLALKVTYGKPEEMLAELSELAKDTGRFDDSQRERIALYIRLKTQDTETL